MSERHHLLGVKKFIKGQHIYRRHIVYGAIVLLVLAISSIYLVNITPYKSIKTATQANKNINQTLYVRAKVLSVSSNLSVPGEQIAQVKILDGSDKGKIFSIDRNYITEDINSKRLPIGSEVLLTIQPNNGNQYSYLDRYRIPGAITSLLALLALVVVIGRWRGITSAIGLIISIGILSVFVLPRIIDGHAAFATCIEGSLMIAATSIFVAHGFNKRTAIACVSTVITLFIVVGLASIAVHITGVIGDPGTTVNSEQEVPLLEYAPHHIDLLGLFLGGMIIASLGVLEDITTSQAAAVDEIHKANSKLEGWSLYKKGLSVGHEHIAALINTLAIVYVGISLPTIALTAIYDSGAPLLAILNDETIMEAVVRIAVPSIGLLLAVPLCTGLASYFLPKWHDNKLIN